MFGYREHLYVLTKLWNRGVIQGVNDFVFGVGPRAASSAPPHPHRSIKSIKSRQPEDGRQTALKPASSRSHTGCFPLRCHSFSGPVREPTPGGATEPSWEVKLLSNQSKHAYIQSSNPASMVQYGYVVGANKNNQVQMNYYTRSPENANDTHYSWSNCLLNTTTCWKYAKSILCSLVRAFIL